MGDYLATKEDSPTDLPQIVECTRATMPEPPLQLAPGSLLCSEEPFTIDEFCELIDEDTDAELVEGVVTMKSPVSYPHETLFGFLHRVLGTYVEERRLGEVLTQKFPSTLSIVNGLLGQ